MKPLDILFRYMGYALLVICWFDFGMLLKALFGMFVEWNLPENLQAILAIWACWMAQFTFTLKDARRLNKINSTPKEET